VYTEVENNTWVEDYEWIGIVNNQDITSSRILITPLAFCDENDFWQAIAESNCRQYFPNNGKIAYFTSNFSEQKANRLYSFQPRRNLRMTPENPDYSATNYSHYLILNEPALAPLAQLFDWSTQVRNLFELPELLEHGIAAEHCLSQTIYVRYQDHIHGPIHLEPERNNPQCLKPREYQLGSSSGGKLVLNGYPFNKDYVVMLENKQFLDIQPPDAPVERADWSLTKTVIKSALRASNDNLSALKEQVRLVDKRVNTLADLSSPTGPQALQIDRSTIQRAQYIVQCQFERLNDLQTLIEELSEQHPLLEVARSLEIRQRKEAIEQEAARQCEAEQDRLQKLQEKVACTQKQLDTLIGEIAEARQTQEQMSTEFQTLERNMQERLTELRQEPLRLLADLQLATALPSTLFQPRIGETIDKTRSPIASHREDSFFTDTATTIVEPGDPLWTRIAKQNGLRINDVRACAAALLAGLIPAINEPTTRAVLQTVAQIIAGRRIWFVPMPLTALSPLDLFGNMSADHQTFFPTGDLADILIEAQEHPEQLGLVVLEGIDRVPFQPVIVPLLRQYRMVQQHVQRNEEASSRETLRLFHARALSADDPYQQISRLNWPSNLLLGVTFDHDMGSFSLPVPYTSWFLSIEKKDASNSDWQGEQIVRQIAPATWYAWEKEISLLEHNQHDLSFPEDLERWQQVFYQAMLYLGMKHEKAVNHLGVKHDLIDTAE
jgi:hypothetical protein